MSKKCRNISYLAVIVIIIAIIAMVIGFFYFGFGDNGIDSNTNSNETHDDDNFKLEGNEITINGLKTMIPNSYSNGTLKTSSGIETYGTYSTDAIYITVYDNSSKGDAVYQGDIDYFAYGIANKDNNPKRENITLDTHDILYVMQHSDTRGNYRLIFMKVNEKKVLIEWLGNEITPDIKNIVYSFYELN
ncbi:hypothetical protein MBCUT_04710 [Methanobrevibacter cuticularis]|uniref:Uncharacterized protein n=1 Tax=Methanobrevibacter cuticularis TaxID=47311 RepID=A0A166ER47_9EURY|nr:hypothetical protein [Methanobrevibacter cuticularis]KZX16920.1 hypothetical protein MBCUT_04710 [Methanobrevibacter cuticularis]